MAVDGTVSSGKQFRLVFQEESVLGTAITVNTGWNEIALLGNPEEWDLSGMVKEFVARADGTRVPRETDYYSNRGGGMVVIPFTSFVTKATVDFFIYGAMQTITSEGVSTPFAKLYDWDTSTTQPQFTDSTGKFYTVVMKNAISAEDMIATSCVVRDLVFSAAEGTNGGRMTVSGNFVSGFTSAAKFLESGSQDIGTPTVAGTDYFNICNMVTKQISAVDMIVDSFNFTLVNNIDRIGCDVNGDAQSYKVGIPMYDVTGSITVLYDDNSKPFLANSLTANFDTQIVLAWGTGNDPVDTDGDLLFKINANFQATNPARDLENEKGALVAVSFTGADDGTNGLWQVGSAPAIDHAWTA